eukprot:GHUV01008042.1.p1 GENE.GHUV01008042.1~~GHUV01008042.1.p1  ORF type:complete len:273 (+),score=97.38 GHUV01008042.1:248-1066(+)
MNNASPLYGFSNGSGYQQRGDGSDDIVAFMAARGGRIQELEEELSTLRSQNQEQAQQIDVKDAETSSLKSQLATWRAVKDAEAASLNSSNKQLAEQLAEEIARGRTLESQLSRAQTEWNDTKVQLQQLQQQICHQEQQAASAASYSDMTIRDLNDQLTTLRREASERSRAAQRSLAQEQERLRSEQEAHAITQQQLQSARQQLAAALSRAAEVDAAAARSEGRAIKAEMQAAAMAGSDTQVSKQHRLSDNSSNSLCIMTMLACITLRKNTGF